MADRGYDWAKKNFIDIKYNDKTKNMLITTDIDNLNDIKKLIQSYYHYDEKNYFCNIRIKHNENDEIITYKVAKGDTIWKICRNYGLNYEDIIKENPWLKDRFSRDKSFALIKPDENIKIPVLHPKSEKSQPDMNPQNSEAEGIINPPRKDYSYKDFSFVDIRPIAGAEVPFIHKSKYENEALCEIKKHKDFMQNPHEITGDLFEQRLIHALDDFCLMKGYTIHDPVEYYNFK